MNCRLNLINFFTQPDSQKLNNFKIILKIKELKKKEKI